jgi:hypothetical protein
LEQVRKKFDIKKPSDWGKLTTIDLKKIGGSSLLSRYQGSLFKCLKSIYKGKELLYQP